MIFLLKRVHLVMITQSDGVLLAMQKLPCSIVIAGTCMLSRVAGVDSVQVCCGVARPYRAIPAEAAQG